MSSCSAKHTRFVDEPMGEKDVTELAGIGPVIAKSMKAKGYDRAYKILGKYLSLGKDYGNICSWIGEFGANRGQQEECATCIQKWWEQHGS